MNIIIVEYKYIGIKYQSLTIILTKKYEKIYI